MNLILCNGFNYYNRIIKKYDTYTDYYQFMDDGAQILTNINFNPADGIIAEQIVNWDYEVPDYCVCVNDENKIDSRWFIIDANRTRAGQLKLSLRRDLIADNIEVLMDAPMYVEKATLKTQNDVAIYNREDIEFNQIKKDEYGLCDYIGAPWLVGFYATNTPETSIPVDATQYPLIGSYASEAEFKQAIGWTGNRWRYITNYNMILDFSIRARGGTSAIVDLYKKNCKGNITINKMLNQTADNTSLFCNYISNYTSEKVTELNQESYRKAVSLLSYLNSNYDTIKQYALLPDSTRHFDDLTLDGKYVIINNVIKKISLSGSSGSSSTEYLANSTYGTALVNFIDTHKEELQFYNVSSTNSRTVVKENYSYTDYTMSLQTVSNTPYQTKIPVNSNKLQDAPYKMFCIPYGSIGINNYPTTIFDTFDKIEAATVASAIATTLGTNVYDIQLLPYFPIRSIIDQQLDITGLTEHTDYEYIKNASSEPVSIILFPKISTFSYDMEQMLINGHFEDIDLKVNGNDARDYKIENQCTKYRLCSPNYSSVFEFNIVKTGRITKFNIDCTYKPFSSYIHINPVWSKESLYGGDYNDTRGLICQGDFSMPIINDAWKQYQINNKNYLNSFNREIDTIELQNKWARVSDIANASLGTLGGVAGGAFLGGVPGAIAGGIGSAGAGLTDILVNNALRNDALDLKKDQFNYSLENIQALPRTLAKVSAFDANNKLYPVLELYSCTDQEKTIFMDKMIYNGMTIMRIDLMKNFLTGYSDGDIDNQYYFKGKLIRCEVLNESTHQFNVIADELNKGVYI